MADEKDKKTKQRQKEEQKKRSLHKKSKDRRKKDVMPNLPFIIAFQGDPSVDFRCEDMHDYRREGYHYYTLTGMRGGENGLRRLARYKTHKITRFHMGQVLVYKAGP